MAYPEKQFPFAEKFRFYLKDAFGSYIIADEEGNVSFSFIKTALQYAPKGWDNTEIRRQRSMLYMGLLTEMTTPYEFGLDGAAILRSLFYAGGIDATCTLEIEKLSDTDWLHYPYYTGEIDFSQFSDKGDFVKVEIVQGGVNALIERNSKTTYEIPVVYSEAQGIRMDGMSLRNRSVIQHKTTGPPYFVGNQISPAVNIFSNESDIGGSVLQIIAPTTGNYNSDFIKKSTFFVARSAGNVKVDYSFIVELIDTGTSPINPLLADFQVGIRQSNPDGSQKQLHIIYQRYGSGSPATRFGDNSFSNTLNISVAEGDTFSLFMVMGANNNSNILVGYNVKLGQMTITYNTKAAVSYAVMYRYSQLVEKVVAQMTGGAATLLQAPLLSTTPRVDTRPFWTWVCPAESMRGVSDTAFNINFDDLFKDLSGTYDLGMGIVGDAVTIAPVGEFFEDTETADLGTVSELEIMPANEFLFSSFKAGSATGENDALQGRYEINAPQEWSIEGTKAEGEKDFVSPFIKGMYTIENIRTQQRGETTNRKEDKRIVVIESDTVADIDGTYGLYRPQNFPGNGAMGFIDTQAGLTAYNLALSPARNILRKNATFSVQMYFNRSGKKIKFKSGEREGFMASNLGAGSVIERYEITHVPGSLSDYSNPPFLPVFFKFKCAEPDGLYAALAATPNGYLKFRCSKSNTQYKGYIFTLVQRPGSDSALECVLLAHPDTDLSTLATL